MRKLLTTGYLADRATILALKRWYLQQEPNQQNEAVRVAMDYDELKRTLVKRLKTQPLSAVLDLIIDLTVQNGAIFALESALRNRTGELGDAEIGRRARLIRDWNELRINTLNAITLECDGPEAPMDIKVNHRSKVTRPKGAK